MAKILIVDDDPDMVLAARLCLEGAGHAVIEAGNGTEGLEKIKQDKPDLIILDVMMDSTTEGFQINVTAVATDIDAGVQAELCKWVGGEKKLPCATASLAEAGGTISVTFTDFTLDYGLQTLRVSAAGAEDEVDVQALGINECAVSITTPADHAALTATDDKDADRADLQYDVIASVTDV